MAPTFYAWPWLSRDVSGLNSPQIYPSFIIMLILQPAVLFDQAPRIE